MLQGSMTKVSPVWRVTLPMTLPSLSQRNPSEPSWSSYRDTKTSLSTNRLVRGRERSGNGRLREEFDLIICRSMER